MNCQSDSCGNFAAFVGIDWADQEHAVCMLANGHKISEPLEHSAEAITAWATILQKKFGGRKVAVALEQSRGSLFHALMQFPHLVLYPINPKQLARYREAFAVSGPKCDPGDASLLARFLGEHHEQLRAWQPDDDLTRELTRLCELRRTLVGARGKAVQQLTSTLKLYFPEALEIVGDLQRDLALYMLDRWPSLQEMQRAYPKAIGACLQKYSRKNQEVRDGYVRALRTMKPTVKDAAIVNANQMYVKVLVTQIKNLNKAVMQFDDEISRLFIQHEDAKLFRSLPGAGKALAPRLLVAMGSDRNRFHSAEEVQAYAGIAPVTRSSGKSHKVTKRWACNKYLRQTFHEFADHARRWCEWSRAFYERMRAKGTKHHAAVRALAYKWIRIIYRVWKDREPYDDARYIQQLKTRQSPIVKFIKTS